MRSAPVSRLFVISLVVLATSVAAMAKLKPAAMRLPDSLAAVERQPVAGRQGWKVLQTVTFGDFRVHDVKRSFTRGGDLQILFYEGSKRRQRFDFVLAEQGTDAWRGEAETNLRRRAVSLDFDTEFQNKSGFSARLTSLAQPKEVWTLALKEKRERPLEGTLSWGETSVSVQGTKKLAGTPLPLDVTSGYSFAVGGRTVAAAEVINDGAVWIDPSLDPALRGPIVAAISALLLFEELRPTLPE
jgi:hypothetical protein